jgi:hypothetical protein
MVHTSEICQDFTPATEHPAITTSKSIISIFISGYSHPLLLVWFVCIMSILRIYVSLSDIILELVELRVYVKPGHDYSAVEVCRIVYKLKIVFDG